MFKKIKPQPAVMLAESMVALVIATLVALIFVLGFGGLEIHQNHLEQQVKAARLAKEASDAYASTHQVVKLSNPPLLATANQNEVVVLENNKAILVIKRE